MIQELKITIAETFYEQLQEHLFPGDGKEAVSLALAGRTDFRGICKLSIYKVFNVPYSDCVREPDRITWSTDAFREILLEASRRKLSIIKIHSHPSGYKEFSGLDDISDNEMLHVIKAWTDADTCFASMIMLPNGNMIARGIQHEDQFIPVKSIAVAGDNIRVVSERSVSHEREFDKRNNQAFGPATINTLRTMKIAVVGCSGTGSIVIEQLIRLGVGELVLVDPDNVEIKNLNRILNANYEDAENSVPKVEVFKRLAAQLNGQTKITAYAKNLYGSMEAVEAVSTADTLFGCVDSVDGRHILNLISTFYCIPLFDLGLKLIADGKGGIEKICGTVHYIKPGGASLLSRGVYTIDDLAAVALLRKDPGHYNSLLKEKYIKNVNVDSPAVISVNMQVSSTAINEFLCRVHPVRADHSSCFAIARICISDGYLQYEPEEDPDLGLKKFVGRGTTLPLLNLPELSSLADEVVV